MTISKKFFIFCLLSLLVVGVGINAQEYNGPSAPTFKKPSCSNTAYNVTISWTDTESGTYLVNVSTDSDFFNVWEKTVETFSTQAPAGFKNFDPNGPSLVLNPATPYYVRVIRSPYSDSTTRSFSVSRCPTPTPTSLPTTTPKTGTSPTLPPSGQTSPSPTHVSPSGQPYFSPTYRTASPIPTANNLIDENPDKYKKNSFWGLIILILIILGLILFGYWLNTKKSKDSNPTSSPPKPPQPPVEPLEPPLPPIPPQI